MSKHTARKGAFTLIEMLVVAGLIAILAAIAIPVIGRVREGGRSAACSSNMKQLGLAFTQYRQDNAGRFPAAARYQKWANGAHWVTGGEGGVPRNYTDSEQGLAQSGSGSNFDWISPREAYPEQGALYPYVKAAGVYVCPSMVDRQKRLSYSMNCAISTVSDVRVKSPSEVVLLVDEGRTLNDGFFWAINNALSTDSLTSIHNGGGNLLFVDGHVKHYPFETVPLDWNTPGLGFKVATSGPIRFRDKAFGPNGAYKPLDAVEPSPAVNACLD